MLTRVGVAEYIADGVIKMQGFALGDSSFRSGQVVKMRRTDIDGDVLDVAIDEEGLRIEEDEEI
jgi:KaiC/GvpD/RAD55 family RecA-like ATPase